MDHKIGNIVEEVTSGIIVQQVNAQGVMGSGIAKEIRTKYPIVWDEYSAFIGPAYTQRDRGIWLLGQMIPVQVTKDLWICNIVGQQFFGREPKRYTSYDALDTAFNRLAAFAGDADLPVHFPLIGCGLGGAEWTIVKAIIDSRLSGLQTTLWTLPGSDNEAVR